MPSLIPSVPDDEVLGPSAGPGSPGAPSRGGVPRWVSLLVIGLLLLAIVWGLLVITP